MSIQVVVVGTNGVGIAAVPSSVENRFNTAPRSTEDREAFKIGLADIAPHYVRYQTASNIVRLPPPHDVVITHPGNAVMHDMPLEGLLFSWIATLGEPFSRVRDYAKNFQEWMSEPERVSREAQLRLLSQIIARHVLGMRTLLRQWTEGFIKTESVETELQLQIALLSRKMSNGEELKPFGGEGWDGMTTAEAQKILDSDFNEAELYFGEHESTEAWVSTLGQEFLLTETSIESLMSLAPLLLLNPSHSRDLCVDLIFSGFGNTQGMGPEATRLRTPGVFGGRLQVVGGFINDIYADLETGNYCDILVGGDDDAVNTYLGGVGEAFFVRAFDRLRERNTPESFRIDESVLTWVFSGLNASTISTDILFHRATDFSMSGRMRHFSGQQLEALGHLGADELEEYARFLCKIHVYSSMGTLTPMAFDQAIESVSISRSGLLNKNPTDVLGK